MKYITFLNIFNSNIIKKVIVPLYINILYIIFKNIILYIYHWPRSEIKNLFNFLKPRSEMHHTHFIKINIYHVKIIYSEFKFLFNTPQ